MQYPSNYKQYPDWLVDATPGARSAYEAWTAILDSAAPLTAALKAARDTRRGKVVHVGGPEKSVLAPASGVSTAEFDKLTADVRDAELALASHDRTARNARAKFDSIMQSGSLGPDRARALAASVALDRHAEAEAAWTQFVAALDSRDDAYARAGKPGRPWTSWTAATAQPDSMKTHAEKFFGGAVANFDVEAVQAVAAGEEAA